MPVVPVLNLPDFDTGQYSGFQFVMSSGNAYLTINFDELSPFEIQFSRVRLHQFTALPNCTVNQVKDSYFRLVELTSSKELEAFIKHDTAPRKAYRELHHYRIFLDESGCHELFAESASAPNPSVNSDPACFV